MIPKLEIGDIILVKGTSIFSKLILFFENLHTKGARVSHAAVYLGDDLVIESIAFPEWKIRINDLSNYNNSKCVIYRLEGHTDAEINLVVREAKKFAGNKYAWWKIPLFALDGISSFVRQKPVYFFTSSARITNWQVCSQFIAYIYYKFGNHKWELNWRKISPDLMDDLLLRIGKCKCSPEQVYKSL